MVTSGFAKPTNEGNSGSSLLRYHKLDEAKTKQQTSLLFAATTVIFSIKHTLTLDFIYTHFLLSC